LGEIIWLASYPKSGNTWLRAFLRNYMTDAAAPCSINTLAEFSISEPAAALFRARGARAAESLSEQDVQRLRPLVHEDLARRRPSAVFVKTHNANLAVHGIPICTPSVTAGAIFLVRDPRDVAVSYSSFTGRDVDEIIEFMGNRGAALQSTESRVFEFLGSWSRHAESWATAEKRLLVRYEDLIAAPDKNFARIIRFLGGTIEPARLQRAIQFSNFKTLSDQEFRDGFTANGPNTGAKFFRKGEAGGWKTALTPVQSSTIEAAHGDVMRRFGYLD
jgi:hypothetical protein